VRKKGAGTVVLFSLYLGEYLGVWIRLISQMQTGGIKRLIVYIWSLESSGILNHCMENSILLSTQAAENNRKIEITSLSPTENVSSNQDPETPSWPWYHIISTGNIVRKENLFAENCTRRNSLVRVERVPRDRQETEKYNNITAQTKHPLPLPMALSSKRIHASPNS
jgi:hypothetical protein